MTKRCGQGGVGIYVSLRRKYILYDLHKRETKVEDDHKSKNSYFQSLDLCSWDWDAGKTMHYQLGNKMSSTFVSNSNWLCISDKKVRKRLEWRMYNVCRHLPLVGVSKRDKKAEKCKSRYLWPLSAWEHNATEFLFTFSSSIDYTLNYVEFVPVQCQLVIEKIQVGSNWGEKGLQIFLPQMQCVRPQPLKELEVLKSIERVWGRVE